MKKYTKQKLLNPTLYSIIFLILSISACDKKFEQMNKNPNAYNDPVVENMFSYAIVQIPGGDREWDNFLVAGGMVQYFSSLNTRFVGEKYLYDQGYNDVLFESGYQSHLKEIEQIISLIKDNPDQTNLYAMTRIMRVYAYHQITDFYGDIPYFDAEKGFTNGFFKPKYDKQSDIYADMLKELDESAQLLDPSKPNIGTADLIYNGDMSKWKRFAYSLMLRLGMRLTKIDPANAENYVKRAIAGGVMQSNDDIAKLNHTNGTALNWNWDSYYQNFQEISPNLKGYGTYKISNTFIDFLKNNNDPRLPFFATLWQGNVDPSQLPVTSAPDKQKGLPSGYDNTSIHTAVPGWTDSSYLDYSEINLHTLADMAAPSIFQSYAEVELLLAEAAIRGWDNGNANVYYDNGVTAGMEMVKIYPGGFVIDPSSIAGYLTAHPFLQGGSFEQQVEQISNQYWVLHFFSDCMEAFSNWRRTGYPQLTPTNYPGNLTGGIIPRRLLYPQSERVLNTENYNAAIQIQGPDLFTTRVWWDKQ